MSTLDEQLYIDAVVVYGTKSTFSTSIEVLTEVTDPITGNVTEEFQGMDLSPYAIRFCVLGSAKGNGVILLEKIITQDSDIDTVGQIDDYENGGFEITITAEDTANLGIGTHPIMLQIVDLNTLEPVFTLTEGGTHEGEFNRIQITKV